MQLITLYNADETSSVVIHNATSTTIGYSVNIPIQGMESPTLSTVSYGRSGRHGAFVPSQLYRERRITLEGDVYGTSTANYHTRRNNLLAILAVERDSYGTPRMKKMKFTTNDSLTLQLDFVIGRDPKIDLDFLDHGRFLIDLLSPDGLILSQTLHTETFTLGVASGFTWPFTWPFTWGAASDSQKTLVNDVSVGDAWPLIYFNGPLTNPRLLNVTTGIEVALTQTLTSGQQVIVDTYNQTVIQDGATNVIANLTDASDWMWLQPGNNVLSFGTSNPEGDSGNCQVKWRDTSLGI